jgi:hypothetical protein
LYIIRKSDYITPTTKTEINIMAKAKKTTRKARVKKSPVMKALAKPVKLPFKFLKW